MNRIIISISLILVFILVTLGYYFNYSSFSKISNEQSKKIEEIPTPSKDEIVINTDFKSLIENVTYDYLEKTEKIDFQVREVGKIKEGKYAGFNKFLVTVILTGRDLDYIDNEYQLFATKDFQNIISEQTSQRFQINFKKPIKVTYDSIPSNFSRTIKLDDYYSLNASIKNSAYLPVIDKNTYSKSYTSNLLNLTQTKFNNIEMLTNKDSATYFLNDEEAYLKYSINVAFNPTVTVTSYTDIPIISSIAFKDTLKKDYKYKKYEMVYEGGISMYDPSLLDVSDTEMQSITSIYGPTFYEIKNIKNEKYQKIVDRYKGRVSKKENISNEMIKYDQNISKGAIIFLKNPLGGYLILFEAEETYAPMGGGKPVIYLYPEKDTKVSIKFNHEMIFNNVVPNYQDSWEVLANSSGELKDLKTSITNCENIKITRSTLYAKEACEKNNYPYLYWSGGVINSFIFPKQTKGFVVKKSELKEFFNQKLSYIGFNQKEINDFTEFWVPELESKNKNFYVISFLQNQILENLFPMTVSPKPDTQIRIFMDWNGYDIKPQVEEQKLIKYERKGFTLMEWGGYKK